MSLIEKIREKHGPSTKTIPVPEWECELVFKRMSAPEFLALAREFPGKVEGERTFEYLVRILQMLAINPDGSLVFDDDSASILRESPIIVSRIGREVAQFNQLWGDDSEKKTG